MRSRITYTCSSPNPSVVPCDGHIQPLISQQPDPAATPTPLLPPSPIPQLDGEVGFQPITTPELRQDSLHHRGSPPCRASSPRRGSTLVGAVPLVVAVPS